MTKPPVPTPAQMLRLILRTQTMLAEAQMVFAIRSLGLMGLWPMGKGEEARMVTEKLAAAQESQALALRAALRGGSPATVAEAALRPVRRRTRANAARLTRG